MRRLKIHCPNATSPSTTQVHCNLLSAQAVHGKSPQEKHSLFAFFHPEVHWISDAAAEEVTEEMLKEVIDIYFTETESVSLLDIPNTFVSRDSEGADAIM